MAGQNGNYRGQVNPNNRVNGKPGFGPGEPGGAPGSKDAGSKPSLTGATKARDRAAEHGRDDRMHTAPSDGHTTSGLDRAMSAHADKMHPRGGQPPQNTASSAGPIAPAVDY